MSGCHAEQKARPGTFTRVPSDEHAVPARPVAHPAHGLAAFEVARPPALAAVLPHGVVANQRIIACRSVGTWPNGLLREVRKIPT
jgi:hypothetical protein